MSLLPHFKPFDQGRQRGPWLLTLVVLVACLGLSVLTWLAALRQQGQRDQARLERVVGRVQLSLKNRLGRYEDLTRGALGFFAQGAEHPSPALWREYVGRLDLSTHHPGVTSLAFIRRVPKSELDTFMGAREQLVGRYHLAAADPRPSEEPSQSGDRLIIELCEPGPSAIQTLGLDMGTSHTQRMASERAAETGLPTLSGLVYFSISGERHEAVTIHTPVFAGNPTDAASRRESLVGWVSAGILIQPMMEDLLRGEDDGVAIELVDSYASQGPQRLYTSPGWPKGASANTQRGIDIAGRSWQVRYAIKPNFYNVEGRGMAGTILVGGISISLCLAALVWSQVGRRLHALRVAETMTASLHEALQRNRSHLLYTPLAVVETDADFRIREWNNAAERIFGYTREEALGKDPRMLQPPDSQNDVTVRRLVLRQNEVGNRTSMENVTRTGERIQCDWYNTALKDEQGRFIGAIFLADDVTERRQAEDALRQAQKLESLGVLSGGIAHDFNNLLTAILGNTEVALSLVQDNVQLRVALQRIEATTQRGSDLARQLLAYAGKAHFAIRPLDLNQIILEMGDLLSVSISKKVAIRTDLQPDLPPVEADSAQVQQVVMNLVINASEAIGDKTGTVSLRTRCLTYTKADLVATFPGQVLEPGTYVRLEVEDDGCGMDAETIGRIFDPFFTTKFTGRGLGLSAMLGIVRGHRAGIRVESLPGKGTTFILLFPAGDVTVTMPTTRPESEQRMTGTILVVDDEGIIRDLARSALEASGFKVLEARDGLEAVELFQAGQAVDLVLLDMTMPRMGGAEAFRLIRDLAPNVKVLLTSGYTQRESLESLADLPPDGFLQKPFRIKELVNRVRDLLREPGDKFNI